MKPCLTKGLSGHGCLYKEVHWSPTVTTIQHPQSLATDTPAASPSSTLNIDYLEHVRSLLDRQRENFEAERGHFAEERRLWDEERRLLKLHISELEATLTGNDNGNGYVAHSSVAANAKSDLFGPPLPIYSKQVREGSNPRGRLAGIFGEAEKLSDEASTPKPRLPREVIARVMTPPSPAAPPASESQETSPSPSQSLSPTSRHRNALKLKLSELGPPDRNLTRDAGHTPMAAIVETETDTDPSPSEGNSTGLVTLSRQPTENSDSYFPDLPEDPALKGPLSLLNEEEHDRGFLQELNQKLMGQTGPSSGNERDPRQGRGF